MGTFADVPSAFKQLKNVYLTDREGKRGSLHISDYKTAGSYGPFEQALPEGICQLIHKVIQEDRATLDTDHKRDPSHLLLHTNGAAAVESSNLTKFMKRPFAPLNAGNIGTTVLRKAQLRQGLVT